MRTREPARKMCANGNSATRADTNVSFGNGAALAEVSGCTGCNAVDAVVSAR